METSTLLWTMFGVAIAAMMIIDLGLVNRKSHVISASEAGRWFSIWVILAAAFAGVVYGAYGREKALQFVAAYLLEESLSVDNMFVFIMIFHYFAIPPTYQSRVLHWGIIGAIVMRFIFIYIGIVLIQTFSWMIYVFGLLLLFTGVKMVLQKDQHPDPSKNPALRVLKKFMPMTESLHDEAFFFKHGGRWHATRLFAALLVVEFTDMVFAVDSIPAIIAITPDTFIVYTSNIFAVMGLRSLYFLLAHFMGAFRYLKIGISLILCFIGGKMLAANHFHIPIGISLGIIAAVLAVCVGTSLWADRRDARLKKS